VPARRRPWRGCCSKWTSRPRRLPALTRWPRPAPPRRWGSTSCRPMITPPPTILGMRPGRCWPGSRPPPPGSGWRPGCSGPLPPPGDGGQDGPDPRPALGWAAHPWAGAGASDEEFRAFGLGSAPRGTRSTGSRRPSASSAASGPSQAFSFAGRHYRTEGAELAPRPDHPIPLWLGTFGRRGLDITGRLADGWIPSLALALPDQAAVMRDRIVSAARRRPRSPAHHLRLQSGGRVENAPSRNPAVVAGSPDVVAERLLGFVRLGLPR
jgi:hypothetical protein